MRLIEHLPPNSPLMLAINPDGLWDLSSQLLAGIVDELRIANWLQTEDGQKGRRRPPRIPRPGVEPNHTVYGKGDGLPLADMAEWLGWATPDWVSRS